MATKESDHLLSGIRNMTGKVILEYVFLNHTRCDILDQTRVVDSEPRAVDGE